MSDLRIVDIYESLIAGEELTMLLPASEVPNFRTKLFRIKRKQEEQMMGLEMIGDADIRSLSFTYVPSTSKECEGLLEVTIKLTRRPRNTTYRLLSKKSSEEQQDGTQLTDV